MLLGTSGLTTSLQVGERAEYRAVCVCPHLSLRFRVTKDATKGPRFRY